VTELGRRVEEISLDYDLGLVTSSYWANVACAAWLQEHADDRARQDKLHVRAETSAAVPATAAVKELAAVATQLRKDMLEVGCAGRAGAERGWVERPSREREQSKSEQAAADLEAPVDDVLMRHPITGEMQRQPQRQGGKPRTRERAQPSTRRDMERDDHGCPRVSVLPRFCLRCSDGAGLHEPERVAKDRPVFSTPRGANLLERGREVRHGEIRKREAVSWTRAALLDADPDSCMLEAAPAPDRTLSALRRRSLLDRSQSAAARISSSMTSRDLFGASYPSV
jgi:hypothetical protein